MLAAAPFLIPFSNICEMDCREKKLYCRYLLPHAAIWRRTLREHRHHFEMGKQESKKQIAQSCYITRQANEAMPRYHLRDAWLHVRYALFPWHCNFIYKF